MSLFMILTGIHDCTSVKLYTEICSTVIRLPSVPARGRHTEVTSPTRDLNTCLSDIRYVTKAKFL